MIINTSTRWHTEVVYSPDDGGYYVEQTQRRAPYKFRTSKKVYDTHADAEKAFLYGDVKWGKWE